MAHPEDDDVETETLRRDLYRPGASSRTVERYADTVASRTAVTAVEIEGAVDQERLRASRPVGRRQTHPLLASAVVIVAILAIVGIALALRPTARPAVAAPSSSTVAVNRASVVARDGGPRTYAQGAATRVEAGQYRYTIAPEDTALGIAARFHVCVDDVHSGMPSGVDESALPPGTIVSIALDRWEVHADGTVGCS